MKGRSKRKGTSCFFVSDLHGKTDRYQKLFDEIRSKVPAVVFLGGDLLPHGFGRAFGEHPPDFVNDYLVRALARLKDDLGQKYPKLFLILGNDDPRFEEAACLAAAVESYWFYAHLRKEPIGSHTVYGYSFVPPSPFRLKDWERYDVSRYVDPGCVSPEEGLRTVPVSEQEARNATIADDLDRLTDGDDLSRSLFLFHAPPYETHLDRAALDGMKVDSVPLDPHVGSIAIRRFIEERQPLLTMHGHVHESARLTGDWKEKIGRTLCVSAAHDGAKLALVRFMLEDPAQTVQRDLI